MDTAAALVWSAIDSVLLAMAGTLLDLRFDNWFWQELIPHRYAAAHGMTPQQASERLDPLFLNLRGTMQWYCIDHWTRTLELDIAQIKRESLSRVSYLPGAEEFLLKLKRTGKRCVLVTNSHPVTLAIKNERVGLMTHFDACYSTHAFAIPKENAAFWPLLIDKEPFDRERTLFVDDSVPVLNAALAFGIGSIRAVRRPDSGMPAQATGIHVAVDRIAELL